MIVGAVAAGVASLAASGRALGFGSTQGSVISQIGSSQERPGIASQSAFIFVGENSPYRENYSVTRLSDKATVEIDSRSERAPADEKNVRQYLQKYGLEGAQLEKGVALMMAADATIRGWMNTLRELNLPDKRLADFANAADQLRLEQFRLETQLFDRANRGGQGQAIDAFEAYLKATTTK